MTTTSADPNELDVFTSGTPYPRVNVASQAYAGRALAGSVIANCGNRGLSLTNLDAVLDLLENMRANEAFVQGVADALRHADGTGAGGTVTVDDIAVEQQWESGRYRTGTTQVTIDAAELLGEPPNSGMIDDPICAATGNFIHHDTDLVVPGTSASLNVHRSYNSLAADRVGAFGPGWSSVFDVRLDVSESGDAVTAHLADGAQVRFRQDGGASGERWVTSGRRPLRLTRLDDDWELAVGADRARRWYFDTVGRLTAWRVNASAVAVDRDAGGHVVALTEQRSGRSIVVTWTDDRIASLEAGAVGHAAYTYGSDGVLTRAESHAGWFDYRSDGPLLITATDPDGVAQFVNVYDDAGRVVEQTSPFGRVTSYRYEIPGSTVITDEAGVRQAMVHDGRGNLTAVIDADGSAMRMTYDDSDRVVRVVAKSGAAWRYDFDPVTGDLVRRIDPDGLTHTWTWDDAGRLLTETDRAGATTAYEHDGEHSSPVRVVGADGTVATSELNEWGQPIAITDPDGITVCLTWDRDGQIVETTDALGNTTAFEFDEAGLLHRLVDPLGTVAALHYDDAGRVWRRTHADGVATYSHTPAGRICGGAEPGEGSWSATFGAHGALEEFTDAIGATTRYRYDTQGNVVAVIAPDGNEYRQEFDAVGRLVSVIDPTGATSRRTYDREGRLATFTDGAGRRMRRTVDALGRTSTSTAPDGLVTTWTYHPGGEVATITLPDGTTWRTEVDLFGRVVAVSDPTGARATRTYSPGGRLLARSTPTGRTERFEYDAAGRLVATTGVDGTRRSLELDGCGRVTGVETESVDGTITRVELTLDGDGQVVGATGDGGTHRYDRDAAGRVLAAIDPTGATTRYGYDPRGLLTDVVDPAGGQARYTYDERARMTSQSMPGDRTTTWAYGAAGFLDRMTDPAGVTTDWTRDASGAVTGARRGDIGWTRTFDAGLRETERRDLGGNSLGQFEYDVVGRLIGSAVPGTDAFTDFLWDDAGRLAASTDATGTSTIERDADGWAVAFTDQTGVRTVIDRDATGRVVAVRDAVAPPLESRPTDTAVTDVFDPAGRLLIGQDGTAYRYDEAGRLAERLPTVGSPTGFEYDTDGLLVAERTGGEVRRFTHDAAGRVDSITVVGLGTTTIAYDEAGRRTAERHPDGSIVSFAWNALDQLVGISRTGADGDELAVTITVDALGRPARVTPDGGISSDIGYHAVTNRPSVVGDTRTLAIGGTFWNSDLDGWSILAPGVANGLDIGGYTVLGARVLDPVTHQFLSPDPLFTVPGTNGSASAYTYAWQDPINFVDPSGMRPISIEEYQQIRMREEQGRVGQAWEAIKDDPWGSLAVVGLVGAAVLIGGPVGAGIALGMVASAGIGFATGNLSPRHVALAGVLGGTGVGIATNASSVAMGVGASGALGFSGDVASQTLSGQPIDFTSAVVSGGINMATAGMGSTATSGTRAVLTGAATDAASDVTYQVLTGDGHIDMNSVLISTVSGGTTSWAGHQLATRGTTLDVASSGTTTSTVDQLTTRTTLAQSHDITPPTATVPSGSTPGSVSILDPSEIRYSQTSVRDVVEIQTSMASSGWQGDPIDVVRMPDGGLTTVDNTRLLAANLTDTEVRARVHDFDEPIDSLRAKTLKTRKGGVPETWGDAATNRIQKQNAGYRTRWPQGSPVVGWSGES